MRVTEIELQLRRVWNDVLTKHSLLDSNDWYVVEISKALQVFGHAPASHNGVVSFLEKPMDRERADKVIIPVVDLSQKDSLAWAIASRTVPIRLRNLAETLPLAYREEHLVYSPRKPI
jgi:hypothetical protein